MRTTSTFTINLARQPSRMRWSRFLLALLASFGAFDAHAKPPNANFSALAETLHAAANDDFAHERYVQACAKYKQVLVIQDTPDTRLQLAKCHEKTGHLASALTELRHIERTVARQVNEDPQDKTNLARLAHAQEAIAALEARVSTVTLVVPSDVGTLAGMSLIHNGVAVVPVNWGKPIAVDNGVQRIEVFSKGRIPWTRSFQVEGEGQTLVVEVGFPQCLGGAPDEHSVERPPGARIAGFVGIGVGTIGIGVGAILGDVALSKRAEITKEPCDPSRGCNTQRAPLEREASLYGHASAAALITGTVLAGAGVILVATSSSGKTKDQGAHASVGVGPGNVYIGGTW